MPLHNYKENLQDYSCNFFFAPIWLLSTFKKNVWHGIYWVRSNFTLTKYLYHEKDHQPTNKKSI